MGHVKKHFCFSAKKCTVKWIHICRVLVILEFHLEFSCRRHENLNWISNGIGESLAENKAY